MEGLCMLDGNCTWFFFIAHGVPWCFCPTFVHDTTRCDIVDAGPVLS